MHRRSITYGFAKRQSAQALVEFALILPVMLVLVLGSLDIGRALVYGVSVQDGAREAARLGATAAIDGSLTDLGVHPVTDPVLQRLVDASSPALNACATTWASNHVLQPSCGGGSWTFDVSVVTSDVGTNAQTSYTSIAAAKAGCVLPVCKFPGSQLTVTATGQVSMLQGFSTAWGLQLFPIAARGQAIMVVV
jgi:Flp pilus assembly protein TadG